MEYQPLLSETGNESGKEAPHRASAQMFDPDKENLPEKRCLATHRVTITEEHCAGHFEEKEGEEGKVPKLMPLYRLLGHFIELTAKSSNQLNGRDYYQLPEAVTINVGSPLPMGMECEERLFPIDVLENSAEYAIWRVNGPTEKEQIRLSAQLGVFSKNLFPSTPNIKSGDRLFPIDPSTLVNNRQEIIDILPHGPEIVMLDGIITPTDPGVIKEACQLISEKDFRTLNLPINAYDIKEPDNPKAMFNIAETLEGLGQLAYIYFQETRPGKSIPVFTKIEATLNHQHQPKIGDVIYYQLTSFERTGSTGSISGQVLADDHKTIIAQFNASARLMARGLLMEYINRVKQQPLPEAAARSVKDKA